MAIHCSTLAWKIHGRRSLVGCSPWGREELDTTERLHFHFSLSCTGEGNGNPLQYSCLENSRDGGACWAAVYGVAQSQTRLKRLSSSSSSRQQDITRKSQSHAGENKLLSLIRPVWYQSQGRQRRAAEESLWKTHKQENMKRDNVNSQQMELGEVLPNTKQLLLFSCQVVSNSLQPYESMDRAP